MKSKGITINQVARSSSSRVGPKKSVNALGCEHGSSSGSGERIENWQRSASSARAVGSALASNVITYFALCVCVCVCLSLCGMLSSCGGCLRLCLFAQKVAKRQAKQKKRRTCAVSHPHRNDDGDDDDCRAELPVACCGMPHATAGQQLLHFEANEKQF